MKKKVLIILMISIVFGFATGYSLHHLIHFNQKQEEMVLLPEHPFYLLDEVNEKGLLQRGDKILLAGFGGGLTWSAAVLEW